MAMRTFMKSNTAPCRAFHSLAASVVPRSEGAPPSMGSPGSVSRARCPRSGALGGVPLSPTWIRAASSRARTFGSGRPRSAAPRQAFRSLAAIAALALAAALGGCSTFGVSPFPEPIRPPIEAEGEDTPAPEAQEEEAGRYSPTPGVRITRTQARGVADDLGADLEGPPILAAFNGVPIVPFINEVFGTELGMSFVISPGLQEKKDLVTLRLTSAVPLG